MMLQAQFKQMVLLISSLSKQYLCLSGREEHADKVGRQNEMGGNQEEFDFVYEGG